MLVVGRDLLAVRGDGVAFMWDGETGKEKWKKRITSNVSASPVICDDRVMVTSLTGETIVFRAGDTCEILAKNKLGEECFTSHCIVDGKIFLRIAYGIGKERQEQVVCIGEK